VDGYGDGKKGGVGCSAHCTYDHLGKMYQESVISEELVSFGIQDRTRSMS
jgi:hypothetical protein